MTDYGYTYPVQVRMADLDANRHVNNIAYFEYLQEARISYFQHLWGDDDYDASVVVANVNVDFRSPIDLEEEVFVDVRVSDVGTSSWTTEYRIRAVGESGEERIAAEGTSVQVAWDRGAGESRELPDSRIDLLQDELAAVEA